MLIVPSVSALTSALVSETDQAPPDAIVAVLAVPPMLTLTVCPSAPEEVPLTLTLLSSSMVLILSSAETTLMAKLGAKVSNVSVGVVPAPPVLPAASA